MSSTWEQAARPLDDEGIAQAYRRGEVTGELVMTRLLEKIDLGERANEPLMRKDGTPLTDDYGRPLRAVDYLAVAEKHGAKDIILAIVRMPETDERFAMAKTAMSSMVNGYLPPEPPAAA